jgi:glutaminyl-peptide cyclotransferase
LRYHKILPFIWAKSRFMRFTILVLVVMAGLSGCGSDSKKATPPEPVKVVSVPVFNADSAYYFVKKQVDFGPRIPNTPAHKNTADYLIARLKMYGGAVKVQEFTATTFDNKKINLRNIIASFNPEKKKRILLAAHWDTRPFSDKDKEKPNATFEGANDGASGVGVLLEIARTIGKQPTDAGIDIILFDGEDWGERHGMAQPPLPPNLKVWWCLGSQYWSTNKHVPNYSAYYGILLDMVGAKDSRFAFEAYSLEYAPSIVDKVWKTAARLGYSNTFVNVRDGAITDDHVFVNTNAKIPMIDIVSFDESGSFGDFHHTQKDNMSIISKETLNVVGQTLLQVIYYE